MRTLLLATCLAASTAAAQPAPDNISGLVIHDIKPGRISGYLIETTRTIEGAVVDDTRRGIAGAEVRIVGDVVVITVHANASGGFRVTNLAPGFYRVEVERGTLREPVGPLRITDNFRGGCRFWFSTAQVLGGAATPPTGHVDTHSTTHGIVIRDPGR